MDDDREKQTNGGTTPPGEERGEEEATEAAVSVVGAAEEAPSLELSDEMRRALEEAAELVEGKPTAPVEFDPNRTTTAEAAPKEPSKKEMELKLQILDLRQQLREKDKEIEQRLKEVKQNAEQARMVQGQLEGYKVRAMKEKADWFNYGHEPVLKELLPVVDNLERALAHSGKDTDPAALLTGVELIQKMLLAALAKFGVTPVESQGQPFNPEVHQAMSQVVCEAVAPGTVMEEFQKGYRLKDRLLRPAMVVVSKRGEAPNDAATDVDKEPEAGE